MEISLPHADIALERGVSLQLADGLGVRVRCRDGSVWITQHLDRRDVVLAAGESFTLDRPGLAIVHAMRGARVALDEPARAVQPPPRCV